MVAFVIIAMMSLAVPAGVILAVLYSQHLEREERASRLRQLDLLDEAFDRMRRF